jgi:hypothetical protein
MAVPRVGVGDVRGEGGERGVFVRTQQLNLFDLGRREQRAPDVDARVHDVPGCVMRTKPSKPCRTATSSTPSAPGASPLRVVGAHHRAADVELVADIDDRVAGQRHVVGGRTRAAPRGVTNWLVSGSGSSTLPRQPHTGSTISCSTQIASSHRASVKPRAAQSALVSHCASAGSSTTEQPWAAPRTGRAANNQRNTRRRLAAAAPGSKRSSRHLAPPPEQDSGLDREHEGRVRCVRPAEGGQPAPREARVALPDRPSQ